METWEGGRVCSFWNEGWDGKIYLATGESDGYYTQLIARGQELGGNCGRRGHFRWDLNIVLMWNDVCTGCFFLLAEYEMFQRVNTSEESN